MMKNPFPKVRARANKPKQIKAIATPKVKAIKPLKPYKAPKMTGATVSTGKIRRPKTRKPNVGY